jgi:hypothetical protein
LSQHLANQHEGRETTTGKLTVQLTIKIVRAVTRKSKRIKYLYVKKNFEVLNISISPKWVIYFLFIFELVGYWRVGRFAAL